jgi:hypothetical protein
MNAIHMEGDKKMSMMPKHEKKNKWKKNAPFKTKIYVMKTQL